MENRNNNRNRSILVKSLSSYVNKRQPGQFGKNGYFKPQDQGCYGLCWAYSIAAAFQIAMERVEHREGGYPTFDEILEKLLQQAESIDLENEYWAYSDSAQYGAFIPHGQIQERSRYAERSEYLKVLNEKIFIEGRVSKQVLEQNCWRFRLRFEQVNIFKAKQALNAGRKLVAAFHLGGPQWYNFSEFFTKYPGGVLTRDYIDKKNDSKGKAGGHAVVLASNENGNLTFINSWGQQWGDGGYFTIQNEHVLNHLEFYDVYWLLSDLTEKEKRAYGHVDDDQNHGCQVF